MKWHKTPELTDYIIKGIFFAIALTLLAIEPSQQRGPDSREDPASLILIENGDTVIVKVNYETTAVNYETANSDNPGEAAGK
jgi:hypothetical protein